MTREKNADYGVDRWVDRNTRVFDVGAGGGNLTGEVRGRGASQLSRGGKIIGHNGRTFALHNVTAGREGTAQVPPL